jgi:DNA-binding response OmpR family regulator
MKKILIVEDDVLVSELERDYLEASGYEVELSRDGDEGYRRAQNGEYDLLLLDIMLPGMSGFEICRRIRREQNVPIIMVTAKTEDVDMIRGLGLGADDYIMKPFNPAELVARVRAHIRIHEILLQEAGAAPQEIRYRDLVLSVPYRRVTVRGKEVNLKNREYELLYFLASHQGMVFSRDTLLEKIWGQDNSGDTATVMVHIRRIREKIEENPQKPEYVLTVWGAGYKFADNGINQ